MYWGHTLGHGAGSPRTALRASTCAREEVSPQQVQHSRRLLSLIYLLERRSFRNLSEIVSVLGASRRSVCRDIALLKKVGFTLRYDRRASLYRFSEGDFMKAIRHGLAAAESPVAESPTRIAAVGDIAPRLFCADPGTEVNLPLGTRSQSILAIAAGTSGSASPHWLTATQHVHESVHGAVHRCEQLRGRYQSLDESREQEFTVEPYWLHPCDQELYVIGFSHQHGKMRTFNLRRLKGVSKTGRKFLRSRELALEDYLGNAWRVYPGDKRYDVRLHFSRRVAPLLAERTWHRTQRLTWNDDSSVCAAFRVDGLDEIAWWLLRFGGHVEVLAPPTLRERVAQFYSPENLIAAVEQFTIG